MLAVIKTESNGNPNVIGDNTLKKSFNFETKEEAVDTAYELIKRKHNLDFGLTQVNLKNAQKFHVTLNEIFDPCTNIKYGALILSRAYASVDKSNKDSFDALMESFSKYNTGNATRGYSNGYLRKIIENSPVIKN
jgi:type IV secretion system protein VirB1